VQPDSGFEFAGSPRFQVVRRLGGGGMGVVYEAFDRERNSRCALKTLRTLDATALLRFKNEFRWLQDLQHPNLASLGELFSDGAQWYFTMELVEGVDFLSWVRSGNEASGPAEAKGLFNEKRLRSALGQLARAL
jgi:serine/threonine protein kinase